MAALHCEGEQTTPWPNPRPRPSSNEARRIEMLRAAAELICERGFGDTRIADVAKRAGVSSALVIYYFGTRDRLLVDALRYSEESFYEAAEKMLAEVPSLRERLSLLIQWTCVPEGRRRTRYPAPGACGSTCGRRRSGTTRSRQAGSELDARWRKMIVDALDSVRRTERERRRGCSRWSSPRCSTGCPSRSPWKIPRSTPTWPTTSRCTSPSGN